MVLVLVSIGTLFVSCSDESSEGCGATCARTWRICESDLTAQGQTESDFQSACNDTCRGALSDNARQLGQDLSCVAQANECDGLRACSTIGPLVGTPNFGGFAGGGFGVGGFAECQLSTTRACACPNGLSGTQRCQNSRWGVCVCSGTGGSTGCSDSCFYSHNGLCDDGAQNAATARCYVGTDCSDCGVRYGVGGFGGTLGTGGRLATGGRRSDASLDGPTPGAGGRDAGAQTNDASSIDATTTDAPVSGG